MTPQTLIRFPAAALGRPEWGRAMLAELEHVSGSRERRQFAVGCLRALVVSLPAVAAASFALGLLSLVLVSAALLRYPGLVTGSGTWFAIGSFSSVVVAYIFVAAGLAARLVGSRLTAMVVLAAVGMAGSWMAFGLSVSFAAPGGVPLALVVFGPVVALAVGWRAANLASNAWTGVQCVGLTSLLAGFSLFLLWAGETVIFAGRPYDDGMLRDFRSSGAPNLATYAVNDSLGTGMVLLLLVPVVTFAAGLAGVAMATSRPRARATS